MSEMTDLDKKLAGFLATLSPPGSGAEARLEVMHSLAAVLGMYLAGDLAKLGRQQYKNRAQEMIDHMAGVAEISAVQLRPHGAQGRLIGMSRSAPGEFTSPPGDMYDPDGEKGILLSAMMATIHKDELAYWKLPGWPYATALVTERGVEIRVLPDPDQEYKGASWLVTRTEDQA